MIREDEKNHFLKDTGRSEVFSSGKKSLILQDSLYEIVDEP